MKKGSIIQAWLAGLLLTLVPITSHGDALPGAGAGPKTKDLIYLEAGSANTQANSGFLVGTGYDFGLDRNFYLVLDSQYYIGSRDYESPGSNNGNTVTAGFDIWTVLANLRVNFTDRDNPVVFYGIAGCGPGLVMRGASTYFPPANEWEPFSRLGIGINVHLSKRVSLSLEEGFVYQFAGLPFFPSLGGSNNLGSPDYPPVCFGLNFEPF